MTPTYFFGSGSLLGSVFGSRDGRALAHAEVVERDALLEDLVAEEAGVVLVDSVVWAEREHAASESLVVGDEVLEHCCEGWDPAEQVFTHVVGEDAHDAPVVFGGHEAPDRHAATAAGVVQDDALVPVDCVLCDALAQSF
jgi:hypothetical protein